MTLPPIGGLTVRPARHGALDVEVAPGTGAAAFAAFLGALPPDHAATFFDPQHPSVSDPGAFVTVRRSGDRFEARAANHGWSGEERGMTPEAVAGWMARSAASTDGPAHVAVRPAAQRGRSGRG
jgi:hypothetical protein